MRVIAGRLGGRRLKAPAGSATRPTSDRVREALFSALGDVRGAVVLDLFSRKAIGWAMREQLLTELPLAAPTMALQRQRPAPGLLHHSDRGRQYASADYRKALNRQRLHSAIGYITPEQAERQAA